MWLHWEKILGKSYLVFFTCLSLAAFALYPFVVEEGQSILPQNMSFKHKDYLELKSVKKQQTQEKIFAFLFLVPRRRLQPYYQRLDGSQRVYADKPCQSNPYLLPLCVCSVIHLWPTLGDLTDCNPPGFFVCGISQARILEQVAVSYFRASSQSRGWTPISGVSSTGIWILYHCTTWEVLPPISFPYIYVPTVDCP